MNTTISLGLHTCTSLAAGATREWLVADGLGGYAMGTVSGLRTRRYHGLLVVATANGASRRLGLAALDPVLVIGDRRIRLATHEWAGGSIDPRGYELLERFDLIDGVPRWTWRVGGTVIEREVAMDHGRSAVAITHRVVAADGPVELELTPLCTWRDAHGERHAGDDPSVSSTSSGFVFEDAYRVDGPGWTPGGEWYRGAHLREEAARGLSSDEDLWAAGRFTATMVSGDSLDVVASAEVGAALPAAADIVRRSGARAADLLRSASAIDSVDAQLVLAADQFVVNGTGTPAVVAGYPWFGAWSRDTMTSYEGLFLSTARADEGRVLLLTAGATVSEGMLANTADTGALEYNTSDATLWFLHAIDRHVTITGDADLAADLVDICESIIAHHVEGTRYGIAVDPADGLVRQGADGFALTWMDARIDGRPVTARIGKPVEINALWINGLRAVAGLNQRCARPSDRLEAMIDAASASFARRFVRPDGLGLYDVVDGPFGNEPSIRPNQLLALSLPNGPGAPRSAIDVCRQRLLTPLGPRSLDPDDPQFIGRHRGSSAARDAAYHQGTVWPWLVGPYVDAARRVGEVARIPDAMELHLDEWGLGSVSETADGDAPHDATGCPFQAWSVAETLRARRRQLVNDREDDSLSFGGGSRGKPRATSR